MALTARRLSVVQFTTEGHRPYLHAVDDAFAGDVDLAQLTKLYGASDDERRYSPPVCTSATATVRSGHPNPERISTS